MIEVSLTEMFLFAWAIGATGMWLQTRDELRGAKRFLRAMIEDETIRVKVLGEYEQFKKENQA